MMVRCPSQDWDRYLRMEEEKAEREELTEQSPEEYAELERQEREAEDAYYEFWLEEQELIAGFTQQERDRLSDKANRELAEQEAQELGGEEPPECPVCGAYQHYGLCV